MKKILLVMCILSSLLIFSCATTEKSSSGVSDSAKLTEKDLSGKEFTLDNMYKKFKINIGFENDEVYGFSGVNKYVSRYKLNGNKIEISAAASTLMAGPEENMNAENEYLRLLGSADTIMLDGKTLTIKTKSGAELIYKQTK